MIETTVVICSAYQGKYIDEIFPLLKPPLCLLCRPQVLLGGRPWGRQRFWISVDCLFFLPLLFLRSNFQVRIWLSVAPGHASSTSWMELHHFLELQLIWRPRNLNFGVSFAADNKQKRVEKREMHPTWQASASFDRARLQLTRPPLSRSRR